MSVALLLRWWFKHLKDLIWARRSVGKTRPKVVEFPVDKILMGGHHLRYPLPYPLPEFFSTTLPEPYLKSKNPTRPSLLPRALYAWLSSHTQAQTGTSSLGLNDKFIIYIQELYKNCTSRQNAHHLKWLFCWSKTQEFKWMCSTLGLPVLHFVSWKSGWISCRFSCCVVLIISSDRSS